MNWFELSVKVSANESVPVSLPTIYYCSFGAPSRPYIFSVEGSQSCVSFFVTRKSLGKFTPLNRMSWTKQFSSNFKLLIKRKGQLQ